MNDSSEKVYSIEALTRKRPLSPHATGGTLKRTLTLKDLIFYGVGCSVGAGIYSLVGIGAKLAGPSIALSFALCGVACCCTSLSYAEFSALVPLAGSAYTFTYVAFGELSGWLVGWNLTLGYAISAAVVARSWAFYLVQFFEGLFGVENTASMLSFLIKFPVFGGNYECCPLAMIIIAFSTFILISGAKESTRFNTAMTLLNLMVLGFVLVMGFTFVTPDNLSPVFPHGIPGMAHGAGLVFFAYLGFDMCSCLSEEVIDPKRNMPIGIVGSLLVSMTIYVSVSIVIVGMAPVNLLGTDVPIVNALLANACCTHADQVLITAGGTENTCLSYEDCSTMLHPILYYSSHLVSFGAIFGLTTATFACLMGQPRIFYTMSLDGLLPKLYSRVNAKTGVPIIGTIWTGIITSLLACFLDLEPLANTISLGTLQVFTFVNAGVIILRMRPPAHEDQREGRVYQSSPFFVHSTQAALNARSLGLVKKTSVQIRDSVCSSVTTAASTTSPDFIEINSRANLWTALFTGGITLASAGVANHWHTSLLVVYIVVSILSAYKLFSMKAPPLPLDYTTFRCPAVPLLPLMGILFNSFMMGSMPLSTWCAIFAWLLLGLIVYFSYGIHHSELRTVRSVVERGEGRQESSRLIPPENRYDSVLSD